MDLVFYIGLTENITTRFDYHICTSDTRVTSNWDF